VLPESEREKLLRLRFEDLQRENERLRDARSAITSQLGPLPISAAIVAGLVSGFTVDGKAHLNHTLAHWALGAFGLMVLVSMISSILKPYRKLRDELEKDPTKCPSGATDPTDWYLRMIAVEEGVRGTSKSGFWSSVAGFLPLPLPWRAKTLQTACDQEWKGLFLTKTLFVAVIVLLILARTQ
jgi:hypothetical protein